MKTLLILAVAATGLAAAPASARMKTRCVQWSHHRCVASQTWSHGRWRLAYVQQRNMDRRAAWNVGYRFGPSYAYTPYNQIPAPYVSRYNLVPDGRYVYRDNRVYVVNPRTYAVERILDAISR